ncbi:putative cytochrome P450 [Xylaria cf. heliscus]|nr:putative cytochrome P450 [Xylaria cf. heliscus]
MLPPEYVDELKNLPDEVTDAAEPVFQAFESKYTLLASRELLHRRCIRNHLYQNIDHLMDSLVDEVHVSLDDTIGTCERWTDIPIAKCITAVNARVLGRVFGGLELSRNKAWIEATIGSTEDGAVGALKLKAWPSLLKPLAASFIPEISRCLRHYEVSREIIVPMLMQRQNLPESESPNDFLEWVTQDAQGSEKDMSFIADMQLNIAFTGLFTSSAAVAQVLFDLCSTYDLIQSLVTFTRWVWSDLRVLDIVIPKHTNIGVPAQAMAMDPEINEDPQKFDGFRFSRLRDEPSLDPGTSSSYQWAAAGLNNMAFGYGRVGCPGRQFASVVIKIILIEILMKYDIRAPPSGRPKSICYDAQVFPDRTAEIPFKLRGKGDFTDCTT